MPKPSFSKKSNEDEKDLQFEGTPLENPVLPSISYYRQPFCFHHPNLDYVSHDYVPPWSRYAETAPTTFPYPAMLNVPSPMSMNFSTQVTSYGPSSSRFYFNNPTFLNAFMLPSDQQFEQDFQRYINQHFQERFRQPRQHEYAGESHETHFNIPHANPYTCESPKRAMYNESFDLDTSPRKAFNTHHPHVISTNALQRAISIPSCKVRSESESHTPSSSVIVKNEGNANLELSTGDLRNHCKEEKPKQCEHCKKSFSRTWNYQRHVLIHAGIKPHKCLMCNKSFVLSAHLKIHERTHTGEKPYVCKVCGRGFAQITNLQRHFLIHTGERPYKCKCCEKGFVSSSDLRRHIRIHTGEKPYKCHVCGKAFTTSGNLQSHILIHDGVKTHSCSLCNGRFISSSILRTHMKSHLTLKNIQLDGIKEGEKCLKKLPQDELNIPAMKDQVFCDTQKYEYSISKTIQQAHQKLLEAALNRAEHQKMIFSENHCGAQNAIDVKHLPAPTSVISYDHNGNSYLISEADVKSGNKDHFSSQTVNDGNQDHL